jgi:hypothetical protein
MWLPHLPHSRWAGQKREGLPDQRRSRTFAKRRRGSYRRAQSQTLAPESFKRALLDAKSSPTFLCLTYRDASIDLDLRKRLPPRPQFRNRSVVRTRGQGVSQIGHVPIIGIYHSGVDLRDLCRPDSLYNVRWRNQHGLEIRDASLSLLNFLKGSAALRVIKEQGMEPI